MYIELTQKGILPPASPPTPNILTVYLALRKVGFGQSLEGHYLPGGEWEPMNT